MIEFYSGRYDILHPDKKQDCAKINIPGFNKVNISVDYGLLDEYKNEPWNEAIRESLKLYIKGTLWSSSLDECKKIVKWLDEDENDEYVYNQWKMFRKIEISKKIDKLQAEMDKLK